MSGYLVLSMSLLAMATALVYFAYTRTRMHKSVSAILLQVEQTISKIDPILVEIEATRQVIPPILMEASGFPVDCYT